MMWYNLCYKNEENMAMSKNQGGFKFYHARPRNIGR